jgi:mRNA interferase RelE/StbE
LAWSIEFDPAAFAELEHLEPPMQRRILRYLRERVSIAEDPRSFARPLRGEKVGLWRYRVGAYRVVCAIDEEQGRVRVVRIGHRREVYDR